MTPRNEATSEPIWRRLAAEALGTALLVAVVVGSGIAASRLSRGDVGLQLLENSIATTLGLTVLILVFGGISGAHFNPVVSFADWWIGRGGTGISVPTASLYTAAQAVGGVAGAVLANAMFEIPTTLATTERVTPGRLLGEVVATAVLLVVIFALAQSQQAALVAPAVGAYIGAAYWFTSSTSFANPAVTFGRLFTDSFAGIAPGSVLPFIGAQLVGGVVGVALVTAIFPRAAAAASNIVVPHDDAISS